MHAHTQVAAVPVSIILMFIIFAAIFFAVQYAMCPKSYVSISSPAGRVFIAKKAPVEITAMAHSQLTPGKSGSVLQHHLPTHSFAWTRMTG